MSDGPEWFAEKRYGFGTGMPISWQGWAILVGFIAITVLIALLFAQQPVRMIAALAPFVIAYLVVCAKTTRGGWRWRWGEKD
jgi:hypothetical protein